MRPIQFVEWEPYAQAVLRHRWPEVPLHDDIRSFHAPAGFAEVIAGGFPCTDISTAGGKAGLDGEASGLWREFRRIIGEVRPQWVIVENVAALLYRGIGDVLGDLAEIGYDAEWHCIPAAYVGAPIDREGRDRVWIVAYPNDRRFRGPRLSREFARELVGCPPWRDCTRGGVPGAAPDHAQGEPRIPRVADGVPNRTHRIAAIGNAVCPPLVAAIGRTIMSIEHRN
jgi:DNA (cytosine-5)-methyltransferase 1